MSNEVRLASQAGGLGKDGVMACIEGQQRWAEVARNTVTVPTGMCGRGQYLLVS